MSPGIAAANRISFNMKQKYIGFISDHKLSRLLVPKLLATTSHVLSSDIRDMKSNYTPVFFGLDTYESYIIDLIKTKQRFVYIDHAYINRKQYNKKTPHFRIIANDLHPKYVNDFRERSIGFSPTAFNKNGEHILICLPSESQKLLYSIDVNGIIKTIRTKTDREIIIRAKKYKRFVQDLNLADKKISVSTNNLFEEDLENAWCCLSFGSVVGVRALYNGIPVFCIKDDPAVLYSKTNLDIESPLYPDTSRFFNHISWCEYSIKEIECGMPLLSIGKWL